MADIVSHIYTPSQDMCNLYNCVMCLLTFEFFFAFGLGLEGELSLAPDPAETLHHPTSLSPAGALLQPAACHHLLVAAAVAEVV